MPEQTAVATNPDTRKLACGIIFSCADDILRALNTIMYVGATSKVKWQAAVLIKALAMYGPTSKVCSAIKANYCHLALNHLRGVQYCGKVRPVCSPRSFLSFLHYKFVHSKLQSP